MIPDALDRPPRTLEQVAAELRERLENDTLAWKCIGGHDPCPTMLPCPECPHCENRYRDRLQIIEAEINTRNRSNP